MSIISITTNYSGAAYTPIHYYNNVVLSDRPVAFYPLNDIGTVSAVDISGNGNTGTYEGAYTLASATTPYGINGNCVSLESSAQSYIQIPISTTFTSNVSVELWVNITQQISSATSFAFFSVGNTNNNGFSFGALQSTSGLADFLVSSVEFLNSTYTYPSTGWHHIVATVDSAGTSTSLYVDGTKMYTMSIPSIYTPTGYGYIGYPYPYTTGGYQGPISSVAIYDTVLSVSRIQAHYNTGIS
jgi:hypothetical protein